MIRKSALLLVILVAGMLISVACNNGSDTNNRRASGTIMGHVVDVSTGDPIPGAKVEIKSSPFDSSSLDVDIFNLVATTDGYGVFSRADTPSGSIEVKATAPGYRTPKVQKWTLSPGGTGELTFKLSPGVDTPSEFSDDDGQEAWPPEGKPKSGK
jgi:hypothetical protein